MFPLGSVLVPHAPLPLHIFEQRYQQLLNESLEDDRTFGVVLISRGFEVGGGDARTNVGTLARIEEHNRFDDGRAAVICQGVARIEVVEWLPDDPYPRAMVLDRPTEPITRNLAPDLATTRAALDNLLQVAQSVGRLDEIPELRFDDDIETAAWEIAALAPVSALDRQRVLAADGVDERLGLLSRALTEMADDLELMAELDGPADPS